MRKSKPYLIAEIGVNYYDTAYFYHGGKSEETIGRILKKYPRESFCLTDKMPTSMIDDPDDIPEIFEEQLRRCGVEYFDNYLLHSLSSMEKFERISVFVQVESFGAAAAADAVAESNVAAGCAVLFHVFGCCSTCRQRDRGKQHQQ